MSATQAAVLMLFGQSNATGHALPMEENDRILTPLSHVFGLSREKNQTFENEELYFDGYTSFGMNLGETQDDTYSLANCLAKAWQSRIDAGDPLPDLYIVHISIGAQGVTEPYMWYPEREPVLVPGCLGVCNISLYPFTCHILSLLDAYFRKNGKEMTVIGLHWRGGEQDMTQELDKIEKVLPGIYERMFDGFAEKIGRPIPVVLHRLLCGGRADAMDPTGGFRQAMEYVNRVFDELAERDEWFSVFDHSDAPFYLADTPSHGIFADDLVHYTKKTNQWAAEQIIRQYLANGKPCDAE